MGAEHVGLVRQLIRNPPPCSQLVMKMEISLSLLFALISYQSTHTELVRADRSGVPDHTCTHTPTCLPHMHATPTFRLY